MFRKIFFLVLVFTLASCFSKENQDQQVQIGYDFNEIEYKIRDSLINDLKNISTEVFIPKIKETDLNITGEVPMPDMSENSKINFTIKSNSQSDYTEKTNPSVKSDLKIDASIVDENINGNVKADLRFLVQNNKIYSSLEEVDANFENIPSSEILLPFVNHKRKWYGSSFSDLELLAGGKIRIKNIISKNFPDDLFIVEKLITLLENPVFIENDKTEENIYEVKIDNEFLINLLNSFENYISFNIEEDFDNEAIIKINSENNILINGRIFKESKDIYFFEISLEDYNKNIKIINSEKDTDFINISLKNEENFELIIIKNNDDKETTLLKLILLPEEISIDILEKNSDSTTSLRASKNKDDSWNGNIKSSSKPLHEIIMENLISDKNGISLNIKSVYNKQMLISANIDYKVKEIPEVKIEIPEHTPFNELWKQFSVFANFNIINTDEELSN